VSLWCCLVAVSECDYLLVWCLCLIWCVGYCVDFRLFAYMLA
jgi:hypothetical protein